MAVSHETSHVTEVNIVKRVQHLANAANPAFAAGSLLVPLAFLGASLLLSSTELLFYTHVAAGAVWFGFALIFPAIIGPTLGGLGEEASAAVTTTLVPKAVFFLVGFSLTTILSGTFLLMPDIGFGYGFESRWSSAALGLGWGCSRLDSRSHTGFSSVRTTRRSHRVRIPRGSKRSKRKISSSGCSRPRRCSGSSS